MIHRHLGRLALLWMTMVVLGCGGGGGNDPTFSVRVDISPTKATLTAGETHSFSRGIYVTSSDPNATPSPSVFGVTWSAIRGSVSVDGNGFATYHAPSTAGSDTVTVKSSYSGTAASAQVTIVNPPTIDGFTTTHAQIGEGTSIDLVPTFHDGTASIYPDIGTVESGKTYTVTPSQTTTYKLTVMNAAYKQVTRDILVTVYHPIQAYLQVQPSSITVGDFTSLGWNTPNATSTSITPTPPFIDGSTQLIRPTATTTFHLSASNPFYTAQASATVTVYPVPAITTLHLDRSVIEPGQSAHLSLAYSGGEAEVIPSIGTFQSGDTLALSPAHSTTYTLRVTNPLGRQVESSVTVEVRQKGTFLPAGTMVSNRKRESESVTLLQDGKVLVVGGIHKNPETGDSQIVPLAEIFDPATGTSRPTGSLESARYGHSAVRLPDGRVAILGGTDANNFCCYSVEVYDPTTDSFTTLPGRTTYCHTGHTAILLPNGSIWIYRELYNPATGVSVIAAEPPVAQDLSQVTLLQDGRLLFTGGEGNGQCSLFNPETLTWEMAASPMVVPRFGHNALRLADGRVVILGGIGYPFPNEAVTRAEIFDPVTGRFSDAGYVDPATARDKATLLADGRILLLSGLGGLREAAIYDPLFQDTFPAQNTTISDAKSSAILLSDGHVLIVNSTPTPEIFEPERSFLQPFESVGGLAQYGNEGTFTRLQDGSVLVTGGFQLGSNTPVQTTQRFIPALNKFVPDSPLPTPMVSHGSVLLADGRVLVAGGDDAPWVPTSKCYIYDPAQGSWTLAPPLGTPRTKPILTRLLDGRVLVAGGGNAQGRIRTLEIYDPVLGHVSTIGSLGEDWYTMRSVLIPDGRVLLYDGSSLAMIDPSTGQEDYLPNLTPAYGTTPYGLNLLLDGRVFLNGALFNPVTKILQKTFAANFSAEASAVLLDGRVLTTGGGYDRANAWAHLHFPITPCSRPIAPMRQPRAGHTMVTLLDGTVLIFDSSSAERFYPDRLLP